jgi:adenosylcobyric acid synthase
MLDVDTVLTGDKKLVSVTGRSFDGISFSGYEMHVGVTKGPDDIRPFSTIGNHTDGAISPDGRVFGTYVHGLFADDTQRSAWLQRLGVERSALNYEEQVDSVLDGLADHMERHLDLDTLLAIAR